MHYTLYSPNAIQVRDSFLNVDRFGMFIKTVLGVVIRYRARFTNQGSVFEIFPRKFLQQVK